MKRGTRFAAFLLVFTVMVPVLAGCSSKEPGNADGPEIGSEEKSKEVYKPQLPTEAGESEVYVRAIENMPEDFIMGMDISSVLAEEASGVAYYNEAGEEEDLFKIMADAGINYIRVRVWNDPFDEEGHGYGGGNNDVEAAVEIGKRAAAYGMKLLVDFHYSDFWADPSKQFVPKAWDGMQLEDKKKALYDYTLESLKTIADAGADIGMVQIGNEINNGMAGEKTQSNVMELLKSGSEAVRTFAKDSSKEVQIVVHYTDVENRTDILNKAKNLDASGVDYDIFGISYYGFWHGTMENMAGVLKEISDTYGKKTCIMETSYMYTAEDGDASGNSVGEENVLEAYPATLQGQTSYMRDVMAAAVDAGALGVFYWEGAWIPVGSNYDSNLLLWEEHGSGWASSYAVEYDPDDAGRYYGGSSWDNQAFFDFDGHVLPSLDVFTYARYGTSGEQAIERIPEVTVEVSKGGSLEMPASVPAYFNDGSMEEVPVTWDADQIAQVDTETAGDYTVSGTSEDGSSVQALVRVLSVNHVVNPSFEDADISMWNVTYEGSKNPTDRQEKSADAVTGDFSYHFWDDSGEQNFNLEQTISGLEEGSYTLRANIQGGDVGNDADIYLYAVVNGETYKSDPVALDGWVVWQTPEIKDIPLDGASDITVGMHVTAASAGWGTIDDFYLYQQQ